MKDTSNYKPVIITFAQ